MKLQFPDRSNLTRQRQAARLTPDPCEIYDATMQPRRTDYPAAHHPIAAGSRSHSVPPAPRGAAPEAGGVSGAKRIGATTYSPLVRKTPRTLHPHSARRPGLSLYYQCRDYAASPNRLPRRPQPRRPAKEAPSPFSSGRGAGTDTTRRASVPRTHTPWLPATGMDRRESWCHPRSCPWP